MARLSTHILDTTNGRPVAGIRITLHCGREEMTEATTNKDGRAVVWENLERGVYDLMFWLGDYFGTNQKPPFLGEVLVRVGIADETANYHVPLLISPYGYTTYRGS